MVKPFSIPILVLGTLAVFSAAEYAKFPDDSVAVSVPTVVAKPALALSKGDWTYYPPTGAYRYGQYVYASPPLSKTCTRNLTIHVATWMCATGYNTKEYLNSGSCIPNAYEMPAYIVDMLNGDSTKLKDTCVQLSAHHYDFSKMGLQQISEEFVEASNKMPFKHGFVSGGDGARADKIARTAATLGMPHMEVHAQAVVITDLSQKTTFFQTRSASNWQLPGLMDMAADRFALLTDTASAPDMFPAFEKAAKTYGKTIALKYILPVFDGGNPTNTDQATEEAVDLMLQFGIRYVILGTSTAASYAVLGCRLYLRGKDVYRTINFIGMATPGDVLMNVPGCTADTLRKVIENGGMSASVAWPPNPADDILINRNTGGGHQGGGSWKLDGDPWVDNGLPVSPTETCKDDPIAAANSPTILAVLNKPPGSTVTCTELVPFGQSSWHPYIVDVAKFCPVTACRWNSLMPACRISCACSDSSLKMPSDLGLAVPGGPQCISDVGDLPADWLQPRNLRCDGNQCRKLDFGPSAWELTMKFFHYARGSPPYWEASSVREGFCANPYFCWNIPPWAVHFGVGLGVVDGVYALYKAWQCIENELGTAGLDRVAAANTADYDISRRVVACIKNKVEFEGAQGRVNFKYPPEAPHSPSAGWTAANILGGTRTANNEQATIGYHTPEGAVIINRVVSRKDYLKCKQWKSEISPGRTCPEDAPQEVYSLDDPASAELLPLAGPRSCPAGEYPVSIDDAWQSNGSLKVDHCAPCPLGTSKGVIGAGRCQECEGGRYAAFMGNVSCDFCAPGSYSDDGSSSCSPCPSGTSSPERGSDKCQACIAGTYVSGTGQSQCKFCSAGSYSNAGATSCNKCPGDFTTEQPGATDVSACACAADMYQAEQGSSKCLNCPEGMSCPFGSSMMGYETAKAAQFFGTDGAVFPLLKADHYSSQEDPLSVFKCRKTGICPGGIPGSCSGGRIGLNCVDCPSYHYLKGDVCTKCAGTEGVGPAIAGLIFIFVLVVAMHIAGNWPMVKGRSAIIMMAVILGMAVTLFMTISSYGSLDVAWAAPLDTFWPLFSIVKFDLEIIGFSCLAGTTSFVNVYIGKLLIFPIAVMSAFVGAFVLSKIERTKNYANCTCEALQNTAGFVMAALFVAISLLSLDGFKCQVNPNGLLTLAAHSSVICWEDGGHPGIVVLSSFAILAYPVFFLAVTFYACYNFGKLSERHGLSFTNRVRFLSTRMQPNQVVFGFWWNVRNFALSLVPVAAANNFPIQVFLLALIFMIWLVAQLTTRCWRFGVLNYIDGLVSSVQVLTLVLFGMLPTTEGSSSRETVGWCIVLSIVGMLLSLLVAGGVKVAQHYLKGGVYDVFVSHHKAAAALAARHIKTLLLSRYSMKVFLDVDELDNLDNLVFAIKETKQVIVVLTNEILSRPWCAVEVATAFSSHVPMCVLQLNQDQVDLTPEFLDATMDGFTSSDQAILSTAGISMSLLRDTFDAISKLPKCQLYLGSSREVQMGTLTESLGQAFLQGFNAVRAAVVDPEKIAYLVYDTDNYSQASVAHILAIFMRAQQQWSMILLDGKTKPYQLQQKSMCFALMSKGLVFNTAGLGALVAVYRAGIPVVTMTSQEPFWKPEFDNPNFWTDMAHGEVLTESKLFEIRLYAPRTTGAEIADAMTPLYKLLACGLNPQMSMAIFTAEAGVVMERANIALLRQIQAIENGTAKIRISPEEEDIVITKPPKVSESPPPAPPPCFFLCDLDNEKHMQETF
eukprot:TRINITY_DN4815_c0_g3_i1.p1 TRINITY_DN4815_c0_g3~~TRINITY_DN4815_c0_g3_i1.p1  ORF type:complete len:1748 (+),score=262.25 TRINITY_DN4815_c0_g3_i1:87-5330(+)